MSLTDEVVGRWAVCSKGILGRITGRKTLPWGESWVGVTLTGAPWASRAPVVIEKASGTELDALSEKAWQYGELCK